MTTSTTTTTPSTKPQFRGKPVGKPNANRNGKRPPRRMTASMEEAVKMIKPLRGRDKVFGMMSTNDRGDITEIGVYNGMTKSYALYRAELVDGEVVNEFKKIMGTQ
jgi:hypothetical protein